MRNRSTAACLPLSLPALQMAWCLYKVSSCIASILRSPTSSQRSPGYTRSLSKYDSMYNSVWSFCYARRCLDVLTFQVSKSKSMF
ncbi:hypothetical protein C8R48DRAFT_729574 [Suillus tomentosus]|nr:hypothetical protein C8R48DRAFT_729574 [Suillus tomentosus]